MKLGEDQPSSVISDSVYGALVSFPALSFPTLLIGNPVSFLPSKNR